MITNFLIYEGKVALILAAFYLCYRLLLSRETLHALNRAVLVGSVIISFALPFVVITIHRTVDSPGVETDATTLAEDAIMNVEAALDSPSTISWGTILFIVYILGIVLVLGKEAVSIAGVLGIIRKGERRLAPDGTPVVVTEKDMPPFSWLRYIVMDEEDFRSGNRHILMHEKAHLRLGHSIDILLVDILSCMQWFNPVIWMLRSDLRAIHEYEADDEVLRQGANIREYQYSLIRKAVGASGYSITNSFNHSILKNRITMMSRKKTKRSGALRALYVVPLALAALSLNARTVFHYKDSENDSKPYALLEEIHVVSYASSTPSEALPYSPSSHALPKGVVSLSEVDEAPLFDGSSLSEASGWFNARILRPKGCNHDGRVDVEFVIDGDGNIPYVKAGGGMCEEVSSSLEKLVLSSRGKWTPAKKGSRSVSTLCVLPVFFSTRGGGGVSAPVKVETKPYQMVEDKPTFRGGDMNEFSRWVNENLKYPDEAKKNGIQGRVMLQFTITKEGKLTDLSVLKGADPILDEEALRVVGSSPDEWTPGKVEGEAINVVYAFPVIFQLN